MCLVLPSITNQCNCITFQVKFEQHSETTYYASGNYTATGVLIKLERKALSHILQIILPSAMFVAVSWISFLMEMESGERAGTPHQNRFK